jgi:uncharacterized protein (DUF58 family)
MRPLFKILYLFYRFTSGLRHWVSRRFTPSGLAVLSALIIAGIMGPDTENNVTYQGFTILFFLLALAVLFSWSFRARFSANRLLPQFGTVGCSLHYTTRVRNLSSRSQQGLQVLENLADPRPSFSEWLAVQLADEKHVRSFRLGQLRRTNPFKLALAKPADVPRIPAHSEADVAMELVPLRRGVLRFNGLGLARPDPLGLFRSFSNVALPQAVLILPKRYPLPPFPMPGNLKYQEGGVALASNVGQSEEFVSLRDYRHGDPLRHIHWRSWAKTSKPVVKEFEDEFFVRHALVLDTFTDHPHSELFEEAVSVAASFACTIQTQESLLDLLFVGPDSFCFTAGRGLARADQMLEILASVRPGPEGGFPTLEHLVLNHAGSVVGCICVLLAWDGPRKEFVQKLRQLGLPTLVLVIAERNKGKFIVPGAIELDRFYVLEVGQIEKGLAAVT